MKRYAIGEVLVPVRFAGAILTGALIDDVMRRVESRIYRKWRR